MKVVLALLAVVALTACMPEQAKSPEVHMCVGLEETPCSENPACKWKTNDNGVSKCKAK